MIEQYNERLENLPKADDTVELEIKKYEELIGDQCNWSGIFQRIKSTFSKLEIELQSHNLPNIKIFWKNQTIKFNK